MSEEFWRANAEAYNQQLGMKSNLQKDTKMNEESWRENSLQRGIKPQLNQTEPFQFDSYVCNQCQYIPKDYDDYNNHRITTQHDFTLVEKILPPTDYNTEKALFTKEEYSLTQFPLEALKRVGKIFKEGEVKYGKGNWRNGVNDKEFQLERCNHALKHLMLYAQYLETGEYIGEQIVDVARGGKVIREDDLAKVLWFCATQIELERLENL